MAVRIISMANFKQAILLRKQGKSNRVMAAELGTTLRPRKASKTWWPAMALSALFTVFAQWTGHLMYTAS